MRRTLHHPLPQHAWLRVLTLSSRATLFPRYSVERADLITSACDYRALAFMGRGWEPDQLDPADGSPVEWEVCELCRRIQPRLFDRRDLVDESEVRVCEECADTAYVGYCEPAEA